jgi:hypothetical protein
MVFKRPTYSNRDMLYGGGTTISVFNLSGCGNIWRLLDHYVQVVHVLIIYSFNTSYMKRLVCERIIKI